MDMTIQNIYAFGSIHKKLRLIAIGTTHPKDAFGKVCWHCCFDNVASSAILGYCT